MMTVMWTKTLDDGEKRDKRKDTLIWALVVAIIFLATGHVLPFLGF